MFGTAAALKQGDHTLCCLGGLFFSEPDFWAALLLFWLLQFHVMSLAGVRFVLRGSS